MSDREINIASPEELRGMLEYDCNSGEILWKKRAPSSFDGAGSRSKEHDCNLWNSRFSGKRAFNHKTPLGYYMGRLKNKALFAHRVAWCLHFGAWPEGQIDHINGDPGDNRIENLRITTASANGRNKWMPNNNSSGCVGVTWKKSIEKWQAEIKTKSDKVYLGVFSTFNEAVQARRNAERTLGYSQRHGERRG